MMDKHPDDALLLAHAAANLEAAASLVVDSHLEACVHCAGRSRTFQALGGAWLELQQPAELQPDALERVLASLELPRPAAAPVPDLPALPAGMHWPRALRGCQVSDWRWIGPGMRWSRVRIPGAPAARAFLLRMGPGKELALHTHTGRELTQILHGAFDDGRSVWQAGDFDETDATVLHQPTVTAADECICLVSTEAPIRFDSWLARALGAWMGI